MARISQSSLLPIQGARVGDPLTDLTRLLDRLQQTVLQADAERERRLRASEYERRRVDSNISYARTLLTRLEQEGLGVKVHSRKQDLLTDLNRKREVLEQLTERMSDLEEIARNAAEQDDDESDTSDGEDILGGIVITTPSESLDSRSASGVMTGGEDGEQEEEDAGAEAWGAEAAQESTGQADQKRDLEPEPQKGPGVMEEQTVDRAPRPADRTETATSQTMRSRTTTTQPPGPAATPPSDTARATGTSSSLLRNRSSSPSAKPTTTAAAAGASTTEAILDQQRAEQDLLSESILKMAGDLKASTQAFSLSLEEDKGALDRAGEGLDRSGRALEAAARRMGMLRRLTEGKGWWGRMMLYAWIYGLMLVLVVVVFVLPKLRF